MGSLTLVSVPIGNLGDITDRAKKTLANADCILAEDTRVLKHLLNVLSISLDGKQILSFHDHTEAEKYLGLLSKRDICLVSDAGSPAISDPAYPLIKLAVQNGVTLKTCPGVSSVVTALELSSFPAHPFHFHGFLPRDGVETFFRNFALIPGTHIMFEGVSRVLDSLKIISSIFPDCEIAIARELTKEFETVIRFTGLDFAKIKDSIVTKGEFVILLHIPKDKVVSINMERLRSLAKEVLEDKGRVKSLSKLLSEILGEEAKTLYSKLSRE